MTEPEGFISRWSRRKREAALEEPEDASKALPAPHEGDEHADHTDAQTDAPPGGSETAAEPAFDLTRLPSIESIGPDTDIRAFLAPGVPPSLTRAALRRAWSADPAIRDFIGLSENSWDFTDPDAVPGFGRLEMTDQVRRMISQLVGDAPAGPAEKVEAASASSQDPPPKGELAAPSTRAVDESDAAAVENETTGSLLARADANDALQNNDAAPQRERLAGAVQSRPGHGRALPE
jgi:hypothetical protein